MKHDKHPAPASSPPTPKPAKYSRPFTCVGVARGPLGAFTVMARFDVEGKLLQVDCGTPQQFAEYIAREAKQLLHHACLAAI